MKRIFFTIGLFIFTQLAVLGQNLQGLNDSISVYFNEVKAATKECTKLWDKDIYGAIMLVDPQTRQIISNELDSLGALVQKGEYYYGSLPNDVNIANTAIKWNGKEWAMIMLPLSTNKNSRVNLIAHELFHKAQPSLGFKNSSPENSHLDQKEGRIYLRLEMEALKHSIRASSKHETKTHLKNALIFREYRNMLYPKSDTTENMLELSEGIAEYTGMIICGRSKDEVKKHLEKSIDKFQSLPSYIRSFAYFSTPVYGYLLMKSNSKWNKEISNKTNLTKYFEKEFKIVIPKDLKESVKTISNEYNGATIVAEETVRDENNKKLIIEYKSKFIDQPHFIIRLGKMSVSFNPQNIMSLEKYGNVYPTIRISDKWGILTVKNGALMSPTWQNITVTIPTSIDAKQISGEGWTLELADGYDIQKDEAGNYKLIKNPVK